MSVFVAIDLSAEVRAKVAGLIEDHRAIDAKWQRAEKLHLTLVFLGQPRVEMIEQWKPRLDEVAAQHSHFALSLRGAGRFETARAPAVLWLGVTGALAELNALQVAIAGALEQPSTRPYAPHVTLARAQTGTAFDGAMPLLDTFATDAFEVSHVTLYESTHHHYTALHSSPLAL